MTGRSPQPPRRANWMLGRFCPDDLLETIEGDLYERFTADIDQYDLRRARRRYYAHVISFIRPGIIMRNRFSRPVINSALLLSHMKVTFRNMRKHFGYASINMFGLATGVAACLLIFCYTRYQKSFDDFHPGGDRTYRVNQTAIWTPEGGMMGSTPLPLAARLTEDYPEVESATRINTPGNYEVRYEDENGTLKVYQEGDVLAADSNFFEFFGVELEQGDQLTALKGKNRVIITPEMARKYFGEVSPLGKLLIMGNDRIPVEVTGVTKSLPANMHFDFDFLISMYTNPNIRTFEWSWIWTQVATYVKLRPGAEIANLESNLGTLRDSHIKATFNRVRMDYDSFMDGKEGWKFSLQPVRSIHLYSQQIGNRLGTVGNINTVRLFQVLAMMILLVAVINFVNLATARASRRSKEIGVKKVMGAMKGALMTQFQIESILVSTIACLLAIPVFLGLRTLLIHYAGIDIPFDFVTQPQYWLMAPLVPVVIGIVAGIYPAFYLTAFKPVAVLKGSLSGGMRSSVLRNGLVIFQFAISIMLIAGTAVVFNQIRFMTNKDLGFDKSNILVINHAEKMGTQIKSFRDELRQSPGVLDATIAMDMPGRGSWEDIFAAEGTDVELPVAQLKVDAHFIPAMGMKVIAGRAFEDEREVDRNAVVINETAAGLFGWSVVEALDRRIVYPGGEPYEIIGVVNDFHSQSLHQKIHPLLLFHDESMMWGDQRVVAVKYDQSRVARVLQVAQQTWDARAEGTPFEFAILDEELQRHYASERQLARLALIFSGFAILIAMLGLMGLVAYSAEQRKKEIGIRKVLGASVLRVFLLLNGQYLKLILLSFLVAVPAGIWYLREWLEDFAYHVQVGAGVFVMAGFVVAGLALISVSYLTLSAAAVDPAKVLKDE